MQPQPVSVTPQLCACGCGHPTTRARGYDSARGVRRGDYLTFLHGHNFLRGTLAERLFARVKESGACLLWTGKISKLGYGQIWADGRDEPAHRVAWRLKHGPIPDGLEVLHHCDTRNCIRDEHLFLGTQHENILDMNRKGRHVHGERHPHHRLTEIDALFILSATDVSSRALSRQFGVSRVTVRNIQCGRRWKHLSQRGERGAA